MNMHSERDEYIDVKDGLKRVGGNMDLYKRLLGIFTGSDHIGPISNAVDNGDIAEAARAVHALKGVSANLSLIKVHSVSTELESKMKNGLDFKDCFEELKAVLDTTLAEICNI